MQSVVSRAEALESGARHYFTGRPCKRGHTALRLTSSSDCVECARLRLIAWETENREKSANRKRAYYVANNDAVKVRAKAWAASNPEANRAKKRAYEDRNREVIRNRRRQFREANKELVSEYMRSYYAANRERLAQTGRAYQLANPHVHRATSHNRRARLAKAEGSHTPADILAINERQGFRCFYCGASTATSYHVDHYMPLSRGGTNWPSNLRIACQPCNSRKSTKHPDQFVAEMAAGARKETA